MKSTIDIVLISTIGFLLILAGFDNIQRGYTPYWAFLLCAAGLFIIWWPHVCNLSEQDDGQWMKDYAPDVPSPDAEKE